MVFTAPLPKFIDPPVKERPPHATRKTTFKSHWNIHQPTSTRSRALLTLLTVSRRRISGGGTFLETAEMPLHTVSSSGPILGLWARSGVASNRVLNSNSSKHVRGRAVSNRMARHVRAVATRRSGRWGVTGRILPYLAMLSCG
jgi:hypothetical protein